jgi:hypothetical protein
MVIKVCVACNKMHNTLHQGNGFIEYICNRCLNLPPGVQHHVRPIKRYKTPRIKRGFALLVKLRDSVRMAA